MVSKKWVKKLLEETRQWLSEGIIDAGQEARIHARYTGQIEYRRLINTIVTLGSILIGLGILLFVASNWDKLGRPTKVAIIFCVISLFDLSGYYFRYIKNQYPGLGEGLLLIGAFSFGAGIWLIAQIYQIHYNFSAGIIFWILGILPVVFIFRSWMILALSSVLSFIWLISYHTYYFQREAYGFLLLLAVLVMLCYRHKQRFSLFVMITSLAIWLWHFWLKHIWADNFFAYDILRPQLFLVTILGALGFILYGLGIWHQNDNRYTVFSFLYKFLGILFISLPVYSLTFAHHYHEYSKGSFTPVSAITVLMGILFILTFMLFYQLKRSSIQEADSKEVKLVYYFFFLQLIALLLSLQWLPLTSLSYNLILLVQILGFMYLGFLKHSEGIFRLAIILFFLDVLSRYFDIFWKMMPRSLLFIFGGILLIGGSIFVNRKRIELEEKMRHTKT